MPDTTIDLKHLDRERYVAAQLLMTAQGPVLIDTGPGSTLHHLEAGLAAQSLTVADLHAILLTHIHLDHAGATGLLAARNPRLTVYVHAKGAPHLIDPSKLVASATRVFGDKMDRLWGKFLPVPVGQVKVLAGGSSLSFGDRHFEVADTPGHASHHLSFFEAADRTAYVGDTGGIRLPTLPYPMPVTPPAEFHLEAWLASLDRIAEWNPRRLFSTHFGFSDDPVSHIALLRQGLRDWTTAAQRLLGTNLPDAERASQFERYVIDWLDGKASPDAIASYVEFADLQASFWGIARYWQKKAELA